MSGVLLPAAVGLGGVALAALHRRERQRVRHRRGALFTECLTLFDRYRVTQDGQGYPVLDGRHRGHTVLLEPVIDTLAWRKLPSLWLKVTLLAPVACTGVLDLLARPRGEEFYSPSADLPHRVPLPAGWPRDAMLCTDDPAGMPPLAALGAARPLFDDPRMKELVVTPRGIRLVRQIWQAQRAQYLVLRQAVFDGDRLDPAVASGLIDAVLTLHGDLSAAMAPGA